MKITQSQIQMQSYHLLQREHSKQELLRTWTGEERPDFEGSPSSAASNHRAGSSDRVTLSETAKRRSLQQSIQQNSPVEQSVSSDSGEDPKLTAMRLILEALTGKKIRVTSLDGYGKGTGGPSLAPHSGAVADQASAPRAGWGLEYDFHETTVEHEEMGLMARGEVETADGRHLDVTMELAMSRDFVQREDIRVRAGDAVLVDPLVINFADQPVSLTDQQVAFDLDMDGISEQISFVAPGSGLLFLDLDNNGRASDGSELFGPASGDGFTELAALDSDTNGWLDDNDPVFAELKLWAKGHSSAEKQEAVSADDYVVSLKELGIGSILLSPQATFFSLNDRQDNQQRGQVAATSLFLREDGSAGSIQEIFLVV